MIEGNNFVHFVTGRARRGRAGPNQGRVGPGRAKSGQGGAEQSRLIL